MSTLTFCRRFLSVLALFGSLVCHSQMAFADDVVTSFETLSGTPTGEFVWENFIGDGTTPGPHSPDVSASGGGATITASVGGVTGTNNLYAFGIGVPTWTFDLASFDDTKDYTSLSLQIATNGAIDINNFSLGGITAPDEFNSLGTTAGYDLYWVKWDGLASEDNYFIEVDGGGGTHSALSGAKVTYFNTDTPFAIEAVPEPTTLVLSSIGILGMLAFGLGRQAPKKKK
ncbi:MAG: hypothetical protein MPJ24_08950, partial [Pirellulaceae bacterium]|nr:hypothetical protein [Pirellulaceae bacterium]